MYETRPARIPDIPAVVRLTQLWAAEPSTTGHYPVNSVENLERCVGSYFCVAESGGLIVGFILGTVNGDSHQSMHYQVLEKGEDHLSLHQLYVHPDHRSRGVGTALVRQLFDEAAAHGIHRHLVMSQNVDWQRTVRFYEKQGFRPWYFKMFTGTSTEERGSDAGK